MGKIKNILGIHKDIQKKKEDEMMERITKFKQEYDALSNKHQLDWVAELEFTPGGIRPVFKIRQLQVAQPKNWSDAKAENLKNRIACKHENTLGQDLVKSEEELNKIQCPKCNLKVQYWGKYDEKMESDSLTVKITGEGVTDEYRTRQEAEIAKIKKEEQEEAGEEVDEKEPKPETKEEPKA